VSDFIKSNQQLDDAITGANNFEAMREAMLQTLTAQGRVVRSRTDAYDVRVLRSSEPEPNNAPPASGYRFEHEFRYHPASGRRSVILHANTMEDLNELIREMEKTV
jgi:hypothetical protein